MTSLSSVPLSQKFDSFLKLLPNLKSSTVKRSVSLVLSVAVACGIVAAAVYFRRKRRKKFSGNSAKPVDSKLRRKYQNHEVSKFKNNVLSSPGSMKTFIRNHSRENSFSTSVTSSAASSVKSRRRKLSLLAKSSHLAEVEKLYQEGIESFEVALEKWEKASDILQKPSIVSSESEIVPDLETPTDLAIMKRKEAIALRDERKRCVSLNESHSPLEKQTESALVPRKFNRLHSNSESRLSELLNDMSLENEGNLTAFDEQLHSIVQRAQHLQDTFDTVLYENSETESDTDITLIGLDEGQLSDADSESNDSYVSAKESWETQSIEAHPRKLWMYEEALAAVERGEVSCRTVRSDMLHCFSEVEFLAKLHCLRQGFEVMFQDVTVREWLTETGRSMIECILCVAEKNIEEFQQTFTAMIEYVNDEANWQDIESELRGRRVVSINFYDVVLDYMLMDAFDDLSNPPGTVITILQNRWLADTLKETALSTAVWSVLKAKRSRLQCPMGFMAHMYDVSNCVTPTLAWGFMGPEGKLKDVCEYFKREIVDFLRRLFSFDHVRYTTPQQMADDILKLTRSRFGTLMRYLEKSCSNGTMRNFHNR